MTTNGHITRLAAVVSIVSSCVGPTYNAGRRRLPPRTAPLTIPSTEVRASTGDADGGRPTGTVVIEVVDGPSRVLRGRSLLCAATPCVLALRLGVRRMRLDRQGIEPEIVRVTFEPVPTVYRRALTLREPYGARLGGWIGGAVLVGSGALAVLTGAVMFVVAAADGTSGESLAVQAGVTGGLGLLTWLLGGIVMALFRTPVVQGASEQWELPRATR